MHVHNRGWGLVTQLEYTIVWSKKATTVLCVHVIPSDFINVMFLSSYPWKKGAYFSELFPFQSVCVSSGRLYFENWVSPVCKKRAVHSRFTVRTFCLQAAGSWRGCLYDKPFCFRILFIQLCSPWKKEQQLQEFQLGVWFAGQLTW